jgi:hypothetical protein
MIENIHGILELIFCISLQGFRGFDALIWKIPYMHFTYPYMKGEKCPLPVLFRLTPNPLKPLIYMLPYVAKCLKVHKN